MNIHIKQNSEIAEIREQAKFIEKTFLKSFTILPSEYYASLRRYRVETLVSEWSMSSLVSTEMSDRLRISDFVNFYVRVV